MPEKVSILNRIVALTKPNWFRECMLWPTLLCQLAPATEGHGSNFLHICVTVPVSVEVTHVLLSCLWFCVTLLRLLVVTNSLLWLIKPTSSSSIGFTAHGYRNYQFRTCYSYGEYMPWSLNPPPLPPLFNWFWICFWYNTSLWFNLRSIFHTQWWLFFVKNLQFYVNFTLRK